MSTHDIVQKLWNLCHVLRDDGVSYQDYVTELTQLLFLKMSKEVDQEKRIPETCRWDALLPLEGPGQLKHYRASLVDLGDAKDPLVRGIYANANTVLTEPRHLTRLVRDIDALDWYEAKTDGLGDLYEGLLEKNANEIRSGAGQYFTPRALIHCMVRLIDPQLGEVVQDPAAGTGGFLIAAKEHIAATYDLAKLSKKEYEDFQRKQLVGVELVAGARTLGLMNCMLHDILGDKGSDGAIHHGSTLSALGAGLAPADVILTNPPFGTKSGGGASRDDFTFPTRNKQLAFLQHIYRGLKPGGRAAVVVPDNVLFEEGVGVKIREDLMGKCNLHTILRLPTGIFYAAGVKTNVLFFTRGAKDKGNTKAVWVYDLRTNMPSFGKRTPFTEENLVSFEKAYGKDKHGKGKRKDEGEEGRFRKFSREDIAKRGDNLDISWLKDVNSQSHEDLGEPDEIAAEIIGHLQTAMSELEALTEILSGDGAAE